MIGCLTETTTCVVAKPLVYIEKDIRNVREIFDFKGSKVLMYVMKILILKALRLFQ